MAARDVTVGSWTLGRIGQTDPAAIYTISDVKLHRSSSAASLQKRRLFAHRK